MQTHGAAQSAWKRARSRWAGWAWVSGCVWVGGWVPERLRPALHNGLGLTVAAVCLDDRHWPGVLVGEGCRASGPARTPCAGWMVTATQEGVACCRDQSIVSDARIQHSTPPVCGCQPKPVTYTCHWPTLLGNECKNALVGPHISLGSDERRCYIAGWRSLELKVSPLKNICDRFQGLAIQEIHTAAPNDALALPPDIERNSRTSCLHAYKILVG